MISVIKCIPNLMVNSDEVGFDIICYGSKPLPIEIKMEISCERKRMRDKNIHFQTNTETFYNNATTVVYKLYPKF